MDGEAFGRYRLIEVIGQGGMGKVYKGHDTMMRRDVAIKVLPLELAAQPGYRERFQREAYIAARLTEPHIIPIHETGEIDGQLYLTMPVVDGIDLHAMLKRDGHIVPQLAVKTVEQLAAALDAAHTAGLVHRDVKPSNALLAANDFVYLIDFGIAHDTAATRLTNTGATIGSWAYMAPERFTKGNADGRADVYSLACVLYECLTGQLPFEGDSLPEQMLAHLYEDPPLPSAQRPDISAGFDEVLVRGLAKNPDQRYQTAGELAAAAREALTDNTAGHPRSTAPTTALGPAGNRVDDQKAAPTFLEHATPASGRAVGVEPLRATPPRAPDQSKAPARPAPQPGPPWVQQAPQPGPPQHGLPWGQQAPQNGPPQHGPPWVQPPIPGGIGGTIAPRTEPPRSRGLGRRTVIALLAAAVVVAAVAVIAIVAVQSSKSPQSATSSETSQSSETSEPSDTSGSSPQASQLSPPTSAQIALPFIGLKHPDGVAADFAGSVYVTDEGNNRVLKLAVGAATTTALPFAGLSEPIGVAVDTAGSVYVADMGNNRVLKLAAGAATSTVLPFDGLNQLNQPTAVAVDTAGNVYVTDLGNNRVLKLAAGAATITTLPFIGLNQPIGVAVDTGGSVYVTDVGNNRVLKLAAGEGAATALPFIGLNGPGGVALDTAGSVYVTDANDNRVVKLPAGAATATALPFTGLSEPVSVAVDTAGNVYVTDARNNRVVKLPAA